MLADRLDVGGGVEVGVARAGGAAVERKQRHVGAGDVEGGQRVADHAGFGDAPHLDPQAAVVGQPGMRQHHAFGQAGGARRIQLQHRVFGPRRHRVEGVRSAGKPVVETGQALVGAVGHHHLLQVRHGGAVDQRQKAAVGQHQLGAAVVDDVAHLARRQAPVDRHAHGAQLGGGHGQQQCLDMELGQRGHPVARHDAHRDQAVGDAVAVAVDVGEGPAPLTAAVGQGLRPAAGLLLHDLDKGLLGHLGGSWGWGRQTGVGSAGSRPSSRSNSSLCSPSWGAWRSSGSAQPPKTTG